MADDFDKLLDEAEQLTLRPFGPESIFLSGTFQFQCNLSLWKRLNWMSWREYLDFSASSRKGTAPVPDKVPSRSQSGVARESDDLDDILGVNVASVKVGDTFSEISICTDTSRPRLTAKAGTIQPNLILLF